MASSIDITKPVYGNPSTQSVRDNFSAAYTEITDLQGKTTGAPFLPKTGGLMNGAISLPNDPVNPLEAVTKRYVDNLAFGVSGGVPEAPIDEMFYARGYVSGGMTWSKTPLLQTLRIGPDNVNLRMTIDTDATNNFIKFANATSDYLRFNRSTSTFELVANNTIVQSWTSSATSISNLTSIAGMTVSGSSPTIHLNSSTLANEYIYLETNGLKRWAIGADSSASGFGIFNYDSSGNVLGKTISIDKTTGAVSLVAARTPAGFIVDQRGNTGIGFVPPIAQAQSASNTGGWIFGWGMTADNWVSRTYWDGSGWRRLDTTAGWLQGMGSTQISWAFSSAGAADSVVTPVTKMTLSAAGKLNIISIGSDPLELQVANGGYARTRFNVAGTRIWSTGTDSDGLYAIADETALAYRLYIDSSGNVTIPVYLSVTGAIHSGASIDASGSNFAAGGQFCGANGDTNFGFCNVSGAKQFRYLSTWYWSWATSGGNLSWNGGGQLLFLIDGGGHGYCAGNFSANLALFCKSTGVIYSNIGNGNGFNFRWDNAYILGRVDNAVELPISNTSDERLKQDIAPSTFDCLAAIMKVPLFEFRWRDHEVPGQPQLASQDKPKIPVGLISQRLHKVFAAGAFEGKDEPDETGAIRYGGVESNVMLAALCGAMQQIAERVTALEEEQLP